MKKVADIHGHYVFGVDDGATTKEMSLAMIASAYEQGARHIFCTSHDSANQLLYRSVLATLQDAVKEQKLDLSLHPGCEIYCDEVYMDEIIGLLKDGELPTMGESNYVLMEFVPWETKEGILTCIKKVRKETEFQPIIAHFERCLWVHDEEDIIDIIKDMKVPIQINGYSLVEDSNKNIRAFARKLLQEKVVTFIGSDAHRTNHRPVSLSSGVNYIYETCDEEYAKDVCYRNAEQLLLNR